MDRNKPHFAFAKDNKDVRQIEEGSIVTISLPFTPNTSIKCSSDYFLVSAKDVRTLYDGRYTAVAAFIFAVVNGRFSVLANRRGPGTPDFKNCWNCPCGFLERNEFGHVGAARETLEETGFNIDPNKLTFKNVQTNPLRCNNGNVTLRYSAFVGRQNPIHLTDVIEYDAAGRPVTLHDKFGGEANEVSEIQWVPLDMINYYEWAFNHDETMMQLAPSKWKRWFLEKFYSIFK